LAPALKHAPPSTISKISQKIMINLKKTLALSSHTPHKEILIALNILHPLDVIKQTIDRVKNNLINLSLYPPSPNYDEFEFNLSKSIT